MYTVPYDADGAFWPCSNQLAAFNSLASGASIPNISDYSLSQGRNAASYHTPENTSRRNEHDHHRGLGIIQLPRVGASNSPLFSQPSWTMQSEWPASEPPWDSPSYYVVGRNAAQLPRISFFPYDGVGSGVAMGLAFYQEGMVMKNTTIESCLPPRLRDVESMPLVFWWPGYTHIRVKKKIDIMDPCTGKHVTYGKIAQQVAQAFSSFIQQFGDSFDGSATGVQLGPKAVTFHSLRLLQVYVEGDRILRAEIAYTRRR